MLYLSASVLKTPPSTRRTSRRTSLSRVVFPVNVWRLTKNRFPSCNRTVISTIGGPVGDGREHDGRNPRPEDHRHAVLASPQHPDGTPNAHASGTLEQQARQFRLADLRRSSCESLHRHLLGDQTSQQEQYTGRIERW
jgi:hypothetical protein